MIEWPPSDALNDGGKKALALFKKTGFAATLEEDARAWQFRSWARSTETPVRMILRTEVGDETRVFTLEQTGRWRHE